MTFISTTIGGATFEMDKPSLNCFCSSARRYMATPEAIGKRDYLSGRRHIVACPIFGGVRVAH
jgi:hypothetical protein